MVLKYFLGEDVTKVAWISGDKHLTDFQFELIVSINREATKQYE